MSHEQVDTRATAYVFGELSPAASAAFERELEQSKQLQQEVDAIRETLGALKGEFEAQSAGVGRPQREAIEHAIGQRPPLPPTPPPIVLDGKVGSPWDRRRLALAALAASVLIICGLAYPYVRSRSTSPISMNESSPPMAVTGQNAAGKEVAALVESFNLLIKEDRYDEADVVAQQVQEIEPDSPIGVTMLSASRMGRQIADGRDKPAEMNVASGLKTGQQLSQKGGQGSEADMEDLFGAPDATGGVASGGLAEHQLQEQQQAGSNRTWKRETPTSPVEYGFGVRPSKTSGRSDGQPSSGAAMAGGGASSGYSAGSDIGINELSLEATDKSIDDLAANSRQPARSKRRNRMAMQESMGMEDMEYEMMGEMEMGMEEEMMGEMEGMVAGMDMDMGMGMPDAAPFGDRFEPIEDNPFVEVVQVPLSTFSIDVDTASYAKVRSLLNQNRLPRPDAVRIEELLNYFHYDYAQPEADHPFGASVEIASCPWNQEHRLARIGIQGRAIEDERPFSNLVFLLDVSGSMDEPNKLPLVIEGMKMLTGQLTENDKVAIVVYAGAAGTVLDSTRGDKKRLIMTALDQLRAGGSTNGGQGILLAYQIARDNFIVGGTNRVILCSDGDFNVGVTGTDQLVKIAQENAKTNVFLSVLGFGTGNHNDAMMEQISNRGNGNYAFIDSEAEANKVLVEELGGTLVTIAKDVKIQIEFNPKEVAAYRLIGYENRMLSAQDFRDDKKDAGEIGAGHTVTALYEIVPADVDDAEVPPVDDLRYQKPVRLSSRAESGEMLVLKLRYKPPAGDTSTLIEFPVTDSGKRFSQTDRDFKFAASVAGFGMLLRDSPHRGQATFAGVAKWASDGAKGDDFGYRNEFLELVSKARRLRGQ